MPSVATMRSGTVKRNRKKTRASYGWKFSALHRSNALFNTHIQSIEGRQSNDDRRVCTFRFHMFQELGEGPENIQKQ